jgi:hypothetical protein
MIDPMERFEGWLIKWPRLWRAYVWLNFCKGQYADGTPKTESIFFKLFHKVFYLDCSCCAAIRGLLIGCIIGYLFGIWR